MSYFEAQSCGLPVVLEENEINIERVANKKGLLFKQNSVIEFRDAINKLNCMSEGEIKIFKKNARNNVLN